MLTKAYIEKKIDPYSYKVRMVFYNKSSGSTDGTTTELLYTAYVCSLPGIVPSYEIGDVVYVDMEDDHINAPVILGQLQRPDISETSGVSIQAHTLQVDSICSLPEDTSIADVQPEDIQSLQNTSGSIQNQLSILNEKLSQLTN